MDPKKSGNNQQHHQSHHNHHPSPQQSQQLQQQQQQYQHHQSQHQQQPYGRLKGATKILSAERNCVDQEQHPTKQPQDPLASVAMDTSSLSNNLINGANGTLDRCNTSNTQNIHSTHAPSMLYVGTGGNHVNGPDINPSSSSYNIQSHISIDTTATPAPQPTIAGSNTAANADSAISQQQQLNFDSPQIQAGDIKSLLECPICSDYAVTPIYQCRNGHLVCHTCSNRIAHCPICRVPFTEPRIRNLQLDKLADQFQFPCKYKFYGCQWKSYSCKKREHEEAECDFASYSCPCPGTSCKWVGFLSHVMLHLSEHHKSITTLNGEDIVFLATDINLKGAVDWVMIQSCFDHHFLLVLEKQEDKNGQQKFFAVVQLIGGPKEAEKFRYKLELSSNLSGHSKRLLWESSPRSILDGVQLAISKHDCLVFDSLAAQHFLSPIKRETPKAESSANKNDNNTADLSENLAINVTIERIL